jgi:hypothetical protein
MPRLVVRSFAVSLDGFSAAPGQRLEAPFGEDGLRLMSWVLATRSFNEMFGRTGGAATVRQYLKAGLVDELHLVQVPLLLGQGERIFEDLGGVERRHECVELTPSRAVSHLRLVRKARSDPGAAG